MALCVVLLAVYFICSLADSMNALSERVTTPPKVRAALGNGLPDATVEQNYEQPLVYAVLGVSRASRLPLGDARNILLYVYAQGVTRRTSVRAQSYRMKVLGCLVGDASYPLLTSTTGVYVCELPIAPPLGVLVTLRVANDVYITAPQSEALATRARNALLSVADGTLLLPSRVTWQKQQDSAPRANEARYGICLMTQERLFPALLSPWISYHRRLGVDRVYVYDNGAKTNLTARFSDNENVEVVPWPWPRSQFQAQNHFLLLARRRCVWVMLMDVDEYVVVRPRGSWNDAVSEQNRIRHGRALLADYLLRETFSGGASQILVRGITMGSSGHRRRPDAAPPESYVHVTPRQDYSVKPIVLVEHSMPVTHVHTVELFPGYRSHTPKLVREKVMKDTQIGVAHYQGRSWEEYLIKANGGRNSPQVQPFHLGNEHSWERPHWGYLAKRKQDEFYEFRNVFRAVMKLRARAPVLWTYKQRLRYMLRFRSRWRLKVQQSQFVNILMESDDALNGRVDNQRMVKLGKNEWNLYVHHRNAT